MNNMRKSVLLAGLALASFTGAAYADHKDYNGYGYSNGYNNGYNNDSYGGRRIIRCESRDQRTAYCGADVSGTVRIVNQLSSNSCIQGRTWGADNRGLWVTDGCRADFEIAANQGYGYGNGYDNGYGNGGYSNGYGNSGYSNGYGNSGYSNGYGNAYGSGYGNGNGYGNSRRLIRCESRDSRTVLCGADVRYGVRLVSQLSRSSCIQGRTWGVARNGVWVSQGCRAQFRIGGGYSNDQYGYSDNGYRH